MIKYDYPAIRLELNEEEYTLIQPKVFEYMFYCMDVYEIVSIKSFKEDNVTKYSLIIIPVLLNVTLVADNKGERLDRLTVWDDKEVKL